MKKEGSKNEHDSSIIQIFYAIIALAFGVLVAFFVYQNAVYPSANHPFKLGLDLAGGSHLVYEADVSEIDPSEVQELMSVLRDVVDKRIRAKAYGANEPIVQVSESSFASGETKERLIVELPGVTDVSEAVKEIGKTPTLEFKLIDEKKQLSKDMAASIETTGSSTVKVNGESASSTETATSSSNDIYVSTGLTGRYLESAKLEFTGQKGGGLANQPIVAITFNKEGAELFGKITREHTGEMLAIFLDGDLVSAPRINEEISGGKAVISGNFTPEEAKTLAENLNFGALPVPIHLVSTQTVGASLGGEVLNKGIMAGVIGLVFVGLFMVAWYRLAGLVAVIALLIYVATMLALFQLIPVTLTAAGLAGFILSLGMAVDANVLVFERMKEEYRDGKDSTESAKIGFSRAWSAIRDGNVTSLLSAIILFWFGTSIVKGFALVFGIGVIISMLTAILVTRTLLMALPALKLREGKWGWLFNSGIKRTK